MPSLFLLVVYLQKDYSYRFFRGHILGELFRLGFKLLKSYPVVGGISLEYFTACLSKPWPVVKPVVHRTLLQELSRACRIPVRECFQTHGVSWDLSLHSFPGGLQKVFKKQGKSAAQSLFLAQWCICDDMVWCVSGSNRYNLLQRFNFIFWPVLYKTIWQNLMLYRGAFQGDNYIFALFWALPTHSWLCTTLVYSQKCHAWNELCNW